MPVRFSRINIYTHKHSRERPVVQTLATYHWSNASIYCCTGLNATEHSATAAAAQRTTAAYEAHPACTSDRKSNLYLCSYHLASTQNEGCRARPAAAGRRSSRAVALRLEQLRSELDSVRFQHRPQGQTCPRRVLCPLASLKPGCWRQLPRLLEISCVQVKADIAMRGRSVDALSCLAALCPRRCGHCKALQPEW